MEWAQGGMGRILAKDCFGWKPDETRCGPFTPPFIRPFTQKKKIL
jgi:hypothetical protein